VATRKVEHKHKELPARARLTFYALYKQINFGDVCD